MTISVRPYADADLGLTLELETDPVAMAELGGPRPREALERVHQTRARGEHAYVIDDEGEPVGSIFVWADEHDGTQIRETGWMVVPRAHRRGVASAGLSLVLDLLRADGEITVVHAFPGVTNVASNRLCDRFGFTDLGEVDIDFGDRSLRSRHRVLHL